ncbi:hypothetical protein F5Y18DRAFT_424151 [Xylariaceae sp. FL1019]|nr:hypothetical protein F5Y18DRAFT_424151 [Xylariaceae sp. FL1019]
MPGPISYEFRPAVEDTHGRVGDLYDARRDVFLPCRLETMPPDVECIISTPLDNVDNRTGFCSKDDDLERKLEPFRVPDGLTASIHSGLVSLGGFARCMEILQPTDENLQGSMLINVYGTKIDLDLEHPELKSSISGDPSSIINATGFVKSVTLGTQIYITVQQEGPKVGRWIRHERESLRSDSDLINGDNRTLRLFSEDVGQIHFLITTMLHTRSPSPLNKRLWKQQLSGVGVDKTKKICVYSDVDGHGRPLKISHRLRELDLDQIIDWVTNIPQLVHFKDHHKPISYEIAQWADAPFQNHIPSTQLSFFPIAKEVVSCLNELMASYYVMCKAAKDYYKDARRTKLALNMEKIPADFEPRFNDCMAAKEAFLQQLREALIRARNSPAPQTQLLNMIRNQHNVSDSPKKVLSEIHTAMTELQFYKIFIEAGGQCLEYDKAQELIATSREVYMLHYNADFIALSNRSWMEIEIWVNMALGHNNGQYSVVAVEYSRESRELTRTKLTHHRNGVEVPLLPLVPE